MRANTFWQIESSSVSLCEWWQHSFVLWRRQAPWDGKIKDFKLELVSFSQWRCWCALSTGQSRSPWPWSPTFASDDIHTGLTCGLSWSPFLCTSSIFSSSKVFLPPLDCFWHEASGWAENMWENITRVFTGAEKAGQTNHLSLYCSTFPSQTLQTFQGRMLQNDRMHLRKPLFGKWSVQTETIFGGNNLADLGRSPPPLTEIICQIVFDILFSTAGVYWF